MLLRPTPVPYTLQLQPNYENKKLGPTEAHSMFWWVQFPNDVPVSLVSSENPTNQVTNSELELAASMIHHTLMSDCYNVQERTNLSQIDNTESLWCQQKGSTTSISHLAHLF